MIVNRRHALKLAAAACAGLAVPGGLRAAPPAAGPKRPLREWLGLTLKLVRHTATYSPPVASRAFAYLGVAAHEAVAGGGGGLRSLAGQLNGLPPFPKRLPGVQYDEALVMHAALARLAQSFFSNTGPTGQRVIQKMEKKLRDELMAASGGGYSAVSLVHGEMIADHIVAWSKADGGAVVENLGFPQEYSLRAGAGHWVPTSPIALQQMPLLPRWGENRTFAMPDGGACPLPPPPAYSEDAASPFYKEALEVCETVRMLTPEQREIARFWADDPMLSPTPPGHWLSILLQIVERDSIGLEKTVDVLARLGIAMADAFIGCWRAKYEYDLLRPVTYIRRVIDPEWEPPLVTPPFPEYPSGHSTQSGAAAAVLTAAFGEGFAFMDATHLRDGLNSRAYPSFWAAAEEAALSRLYGGIHFRSAIERGLEQGRCVGAYANALKT